MQQKTGMTQGKYCQSLNNIYAKNLAWKNLYFKHFLACFHFAIGCPSSTAKNLTLFPKKNQSKAKTVHFFNCEQIFLQAVCQPKK